MSFPDLFDLEGCCTTAELCSHPGNTQTERRADDDSEHEADDEALGGSGPRRHTEEETRVGSVNS